MKKYVFNKPSSRENKYQINFIVDYCVEQKIFLEELILELKRRMDSVEAYTKLSELYNPQIIFQTKVDSNKICFSIDIEMITPKFTFEKDINIVNKTIEFVLAFLEGVDSFSNKTLEDDILDFEDEEEDNIEYKILGIIEKEYLYEIEEVAEEEIEIEAITDEEVKQNINKILKESEVKIVMTEAETTNIDFKKYFLDNAEIEYKKYIPPTVKKVLKPNADIQEIELEDISNTDIVACVYSFDARNTPKMYETQIIKNIMQRRFLKKLRDENSLVYFVSDVDYLNMEYIVFYTEVEKHKTDTVVKLCDEVEKEFFSKKISYLEFIIALKEYLNFSNSKYFIELYEEQIKENIVDDIELRTFRKKYRKLDKITLKSIINEVDRIKKICKIKFIGVDLDD